MSFVSTIGDVRRSQAVFTYGIGAIVDFAKGSFMPLGLQHMEWQWARLPMEAKDSVCITESRLQRLLGVTHFKTMPVPPDRQISEFGARVKQEWTLPVTRFPRWLECPKCHRLGSIGDPFEAQPDGRVVCLRCDKNEVTPVRFVIACKHGHIDDFPWFFWAHPKKWESCKKPVLYLRSLGQSAALSDLYVRCESCKDSQSLGDIFLPYALKAIRCNGYSPWLLMKGDCGEEVQTLQRGASNVHFSVTASVLSIPPASEAIAKLLEREWAWISSVPVDAIEPVVRGFLEKKGWTIDLSVALDWIRRRRGIETAPPSDERRSRFQEYEALGTATPALTLNGHTPEFENDVFAPPADVLPWIDIVGAVHRLREVRAYCGFTRITPWPLPVESIADALKQRKIAPLSGVPIGWLPAIEVRGEGLFLRFREDRVATWELNPAVQHRAAIINDVFLKQCKGVGLIPAHRITPRLLLVHSLSHALIRRLSLDCGYSSASLRERLYVSERDSECPPMAGLLIYTASPDSDGSLGGLVALAQPDLVSSVLRRAIADAGWCGNDPVCIETHPPTTGERLNGAACHSCLLVSETSCERFNRELDRMLLVGGSDLQGQLVEGYFATLNES